jgi:lipid-A-disaccharide synthase
MGELKKRQPDIRFSGFGGLQMEQAGCRLLYPMTELAVMGIFAVIPHLWYFYKLIRRANRFFRESRPDAVVLIDFPGFNWWIARKAKALGIPAFYYFPPQLWAWGEWRIAKVRRFVDHVLCTLPFEKQWYAERGIGAEYVGHPIFDEIAEYPLAEEFYRVWSAPKRKKLTILPGSRDREVTFNWPIILEVIRRVHTTDPNTAFLVGCYKEEHHRWCQSQLTESDRRLPIHFFVGKTPECIDCADCCLMVSGSVSLEVLARGKPAVVLYRVTRFFRIIAHFIVSCRFLSLPNLMAGRAVMPEFYCAWGRRGDIDKMSCILSGWLGDRRKLVSAAAEMSKLYDAISRPGATKRVADAILSRVLHGNAPGRAA